MLNVVVSQVLGQFDLVEHQLIKLSLLTSVATSPIGFEGQCSLLTALFISTG